VPINLSGFPEPFRPLREPLRSLVGQYEATLVTDRTHSHKTIRDFCDAIEGFFYDHPETKRPEQILIVDVEDWRLAMEERMAPNTVRKYLCCVKAFYSWLRKTGRNIEDPVVIPKPRAANPTKKIVEGSGVPIGSVQLPLLPCTYSPGPLSVAS
jgi:site-specific recombinase XerD